MFCGSWGALNRESIDFRGKLFQLKTHNFDIPWFEIWILVVLTRSQRHVQLSPVLLQLQMLKGQREVLNGLLVVKGEPVASAAASCVCVFNCVYGPCFVGCYRCR